MILFYCSHYTDFAQDLFYAGLAKVLEKEQIIEYPFHREFHNQTNLYPLNIGYAPGSGRKKSWREVIRLSKKGTFKLIIVGSAKKGPLNNLLQLRKTVSHLLPPSIFRWRRSL